MTDAERKALAERLGDLALLTFETALEHIAAVVAGEKRLALVPRKHPKVKDGPIMEFRLVTPPQVKMEEAPTTDGWKPDESELDQPPVPADALAPGQPDDNTRYDRDDSRDDIV